MSRKRRAALAGASLLLLASCTDSDPAGPSGSDDAVQFSITGLPALAQSEGTFELWVSFALTGPGAPAPRHSEAASMGRFMINDTGQVVGADYQPMTFGPTPDDENVPTDADGNVLWQLAVDAFVTLEADPDADPEPRLPALIAGSFLNGSASLGVFGGDAINRDFTSASGSFHLATPTTTATDDETRGAWFAAVGGGSSALTLPSLPSGWVYEGWISHNSLGFASLGRFTATDGADDDGGGPLVGDGSAYPFPGSDFPFGTADLDLADASVLITLEPSGNEDGNGPFFLEIMGAPAPDDAAVQTAMTNVASFPSASVTIPFQP